jgi:hypothetical protein
MKGWNVPLRKRHVVYLAVAAVVVSVSIVSVLVYCGISASLTAERVLHANRLVLELAREYVVDHIGAWPRFWQDLERLPPPERGMFRWPQDEEDVRRYVSVDFGANLDELVTRSMQEFVAIQPQGPCCSYDEEVAQLIEAIRRSGNRDKRTTPP